ncbi:MAG: magnesium transporter [Burkholderiaceae bacterium]|nr:magnesium transporter [Burkholderiaceae bacterium]
MPEGLEDDARTATTSDEANPGAAQGGTDELTHESSSPRDPESATRALSEVQDWLGRLDLIRSMARQEADGGATADRLVERINEAQLLAHLEARVNRLHPADAAYVLESLPRDERLIVWDLVDGRRDGDILVEVSDAVRETLVRSMDHAELVAATSSLDADELADIAPDLPRAVVEQVQAGLTPEEREQLREAMSYDEESVGARMEFDLVTVREDVTLEVVLRYLRRFDRLPPHTDKIFVVDRDEVLKGALPIARVLTNEPDTLVADVMEAETLTLDASDDIYEAAQAFERYDLVSAPVIGASDRLIGRLTVAEVVDVIREEGEAEVFGKVGLREEEDLFAGVLASARNRWLWLALNLCTAFFASRVIGAFEGTIERVVALATLMPIVAGIAGNSGNQTMTLIIRSLALGQLTSSNLRRLMWKELVIAGLNGIVWGGIAGLFAWWLYSDSPQGVLLGATMMGAMLLNLLLGALVAMVVPLVLERIGRDPAIGSSVLLTFSTDSLGFFIFLGLATLLFR